MQERTRAEKIIEFLRDSPKTLDEACEVIGIEYDDLTPDNFLEIDSEIFNCECCDWWCSSEENKDGCCDDCAEVCGIVY